MENKNIETAKLDYVSSGRLKEPKKIEVKVTSEEQLSVFKGIRPENMDFEVFKQVRKDLKKSTKLYLGGKYKHFSVNLSMIPGMPSSQGTYVRTKPKRWEKDHRMWQIGREIKMV